MTSGERDAVRWAVQQDSRPLQQDDPSVAVGVTAARVDSLAGVPAVPKGATVWMVGFFGLLEGISAPASSGGEPVVAPATQLSDLYVFVDPVDGRVLGSFSVPAGSCGDASSPGS